MQTATFRRASQKGGMEILQGGAGVWKASIRGEGGQTLYEGHHTQKEGSGESIKGII